MTPHKQRNLHRPEEGIYGDCGRTVIACLLDLEPEQVPHFWDGPWEKDKDPTTEARAWLAERGIQIWLIYINGDLTVNAVLHAIGNQNPDQHWALVGRSRNGTDHVVICKGPDIAHDPALDDSGIVGPGSNGFYQAEFYTRGL